MASLRDGTGAMEEAASAGKKYPWEVFPRNKTAVETFRRFDTAVPMGLLLGHWWRCPWGGWRETGFLFTRLRPRKASVWP